MVFSKSQTKHEASNRSQCMHPKQNERAIRKTKALLSKRKPSNRFVMHPPGESGCIFSMHFFSRNPSRGWRRRKRARIIHIFGCICRFTLEICKNIKKRTETLYQSFSPLMVEARGIEPLSEDRITGFSPSAGRILDFPCPSACERAMGLGSFILPASPQSLGGPVPHINDAACQSRERFGATRSH